MEKKIISLIEEKGPLTGSEIWAAVGGDGLNLWRICKLSKELMIQITGIRYLRLDKRIADFARLSPSIWREFLTYSVVGLSGDRDLIEKRARAVILKIGEISKDKLELGYRIASGLASQLEWEWALEQQACFIIAGDIVYKMAHDVPRPEKSTGKMVQGSDIDLVVIADDHIPDALIKRLDEAIYKEKYRLLVTPHVKEEIDYVVKKLNRFREQVCFDTFRHMVACKILNEGELLFGNEDLFNKVKAMLREEGVTDKLEDMERRARDFRKNAEEILLYAERDEIKEEHAYLFYPTEESEEFELE
jgi:hypothetical protein